MSRGEGPREAGIGATANTAHRRPHGASHVNDRPEAAGMSRGEGPREAGIGATANTASILASTAEAAE